MKPHVDLSVVVVNYNQESLLRNCLTSVFLNRLPLHIQVIVVDNGSKDNSLQMLKDHFPQVQVIANQQNLGFAKANNQAIPMCEGRHIALLNNDTVVLDSALQLLTRFVDQHPRVGCVGPQLLNADGSIQPSCMRFPSLVGSLRNFIGARVGRGAKYVPKLQTDYACVDAVTGACLMLRKDALADVGLLDDGYFMYAEEMDWCHRASQNGWQVAYYPAGKVVHLGGQTTRAEPARFYVERRYSRVRFYLKHHGLVAARLTDCMIRLWIVIRWGLATGSQRTYYRQILSLYNERVGPLYVAEAG